jgi:glycosyltransferase involved in cell wall biosynthesis
MSRLRVLILASHYRADHVAKMRVYNQPNSAASSWNTALFDALGFPDLELHIVQFYPVLKRYRFDEGNVVYHYLPRVPKVDGFTSLVKRFRVGRLARELDPDLIHGIGSEHGHALAAVHARWPSVITIHGYLKFINKLPGHASLLKRLFLEREERQALLRADRVVAINGYMRDQFVAAGCASDRIDIVPNALNPAYLDAASREVPRDRDIDILIVGTLHPLKNQHLALEILARLRDRHGVTLRAVIVGTPTAASRDYAQKLADLRESMRLDGVEFAGRKNPQELAELYGRSRVLLHLSAFETDSVVVAEAQACGALPVVNPVAGLAYRVRDGVNGFHLAIADRDAAAARLKEILETWKDTQRMRERARSDVARERSPEGVAEATRRAYRLAYRPVLREAVEA